MVFEDYNVGIGFAMDEQEIKIAETFPKTLKELRQNKGWSQGQLAKKVGVDIQRISKYERGVSCPTPDMMVKLATALGVSLDYLLKGEKEMDESYIQNQEWLKRLEKLNHLPQEDQISLMKVIDAVLRNHHFEEMLHGKF